MKGSQLSGVSEEMKAAWNNRAQKDAYHYVETQFWNHDQTAFFALGEERARILIVPVLKTLGIEGSGKTAVDIGCGVGRFTQALGRRFGEAIGIDVSDKMIAQAKAAAPNLANLTFIVSDGVSLPQPSDSADFVWSYEVFQHMPALEVIRSNLREVVRILRSSGYGLLHFRCPHEYPTILSHVSRFVPVSLIRTIKHLLGKDPLTADLSWRGAKPLTKSDIHAMCKNAGLDVVEFRDDPTHQPGTRVFAVVRRAP